MVPTRFAVPSARRFAGATLLAAHVAACGGQQHASPTTHATPAKEVQASSSPPLTVPAGAQHLAVPTPPQGRGALHEELQRFWTFVENTIAKPAPTAPAAGTEDEVGAWASGPLLNWLKDRQDAVQAAVLKDGWLDAIPPEEQAMAAGLYAYAFEDTVSAIRGAPVPAAIAKDEELLAIYREALLEVLRPLARLAVEGFYRCRQGFLEAQALPWADWARYCDGRGAEIRDDYQLVDKSSKH